MRIYELVPDPNVLIALASEELAFQLLQVARTNLQNGIVHRNSIIETKALAGQNPVYTQQQQPQVEMALMEALHWLEVTGLLIPAPGINGTNGFKVFSRRGQEVLDRNRFDDYRRAIGFPKSLLHPAIAERVWISLARGELDTAVFQAFKAVEEAVRAKGGFANTDIGVVLMRRAFHADTGPLTRQTDPPAEKQALLELFTGAIGSYKNPHSHRTVTLDVQEAQEQVVFASHLLRIVDSRP